MNILVSLGSGKATCPKCHKSIIKNDIQLAGFGYRDGANFHLSCIMTEVSAVMINTADNRDLETKKHNELLKRFNKLSK